MIIYTYGNVIAEVEFLVKLFDMLDDFFFLVGNMYDFFINFPRAHTAKQMVCLPVFMISAY